MTEEQTDKPLPCQFCARQARAISPSGFVPEWTIGCFECEIAPTVENRTKAEAIKLWNRRAKT